MIVMSAQAAGRAQRQLNLDGQRDLHPDGLEALRLLEDATELDCRWPYDGVEGPMCCGRLRPRGHSYCEAHEKRALPAKAARQQQFDSPVFMPLSIERLGL